MRLDKRVLSLVVAVTIMALAAPAMAQVTGAITAGGGTFTATNAGNGATIAQAAGSNQVVTWSKFNLTNGNTVQYTVNAAPNNNVLNILTPGTGVFASIAGTISTQGAANPGNIYFFSQGGIVFGQGAQINPGNGGVFFAAAKDYTGDRSAAFVGTSLAGNLTATPSLSLNNATLNVGAAVHGGANPNLWLVGDQFASFAGNYTIGASPVVPGANAVGNVATLTVAPAGAGAASMTANSGTATKNQMWFGKIDNAAMNVDVTLTGLQIWVPSVTAKSFTATGGTDQSVLWNAGVWVYDQYPQYTGTNAIQTAGAVNIQGAWDWVSGKIQAAGNVTIGGTPAGKTVSVWLVDVAMTGANTLKLIADGTTATAVNVLGIAVPKDSGGSVWVNSINAPGPGATVTINAKNEFAVWLDTRIGSAAARNDNGISINGANVTTTAGVDALLVAGTTPNYLVRINTAHTGTLLKGSYLPTDKGGYYY